MTEQPLPIDAHLGDVAQKLSSEGSVLIVEAPPGAGKTTRIPSHLITLPWCTHKVLVSEPRRIAARLSANRVAAQLAERLGESVGYRVRFDDKTSARTRLIYMTEGLLLRQLLEGDNLGDVSAIVLDEVHERSADLDVILALLKKLKAGWPKLRVVLMSATLESEPLKEFFPEAKCISSPGRSYAVEIVHAPRDDERPLPVKVRSAVREGLKREGDMLVFLPGGAEIRACEAALKELPQIEVVPLHGDLPLEAQARAMRPGDTRRVVLSTNVAESSVTIPGVTTVIDSGLARSGVFDRWSGVSRLETVTISQARCIQRAGRAGRVADGQALRLYTKGDFTARNAQDPPELLRSDLSSILLMLLAADRPPDSLEFLSPPEPSAWQKAEEFLRTLSALDGHRLTETGRLMSLLPVPPRLSRVAVEGARLGIAEEACRAAALLSQRDILLPARSFRPGITDIVASDSDLEDRLDRLRQLAHSRFDKRLSRDLDVDWQGARQAEQLAQTLTRTLSRHLRPGQEPPPGALSRALLCGFFDRVAERRGTGRDLVLCGGTQASLHETSSVVSARLVLALAADAPGGRQRKAQVRLACRLDPDWLLDLAPERIETGDELTFNAAQGRVEQIGRLTYGKVTLDESRVWPGPSPEVARVLVKAAHAKGPAVYDPEGRLEALLARLSLLLKYSGHLFDACTSDEKAQLSALRDGEELSEENFRIHALSAAAGTRTRLSELSLAHLDSELLGFLPQQVSLELDRQLPVSVQLRGGRSLPVNYEKGRDPWVASRLQDFFSMADTPTLCRGQLPVTLHLLAPNQRAVQVTSDLSGFWERHYPDLRKQLMRRYPKHLWPEDGRTARPPTPGKIR